MRLSLLSVLLLAAAGLVLGACGPGKPGPQPGQTYFWRVTSSGVQFNDNCSDEPAFRAANGPLKFSTNEDTNGNGRLDPGEDVNGNGRLDGDSYIVYKGSDDGKKATLMKCTMLDPATCTPADSGVVFDVAGAEMTYATEVRTDTGSGMCKILDTQSWIVTDKLTTLDVQISDTLQLVDDPTICAQLEANAKARAPNGKGFEGCTITFAIGATNR